jgi:hypothetical protein
MNKKYIFKMVWRGWFAGVTAIFTPLFILVAILSPETPKQMLLAVPLIPLVAAVQGAMFGGLVILGLTIWPSKKSVQI